jgi:uncharacterized lipoprotein YddW (UPF0748 family)
MDLHHKTGTLIALSAIVFLATPLVTQSHRPDPLGSAAFIGLNQAWYHLNGYAGNIDEVSYVALPSQATRSGSSINTFQRAAWENMVYLPLVSELAVSTCEARALWITRWDYSSADELRILVDNAAYAGFNMLLLQVRGTADALYEPGLEPWAARLAGSLGQDPEWDPLEVAIERARSHDMETHAYLNAYPVWSGATAPPEDTTPEHLFWTLSHRHTWDDWRVWTADGPMLLADGSYLWATPALTDTVDRIVAVALDLAGRYEIAGIHLDMVRYPGRGYSYDPFSQMEYARAVANEPGLARAEWQRRQVTGLVHHIRSELAAEDPRLLLSAAVWPVCRDVWGWGYSEGYGDYYQDSHRWLRDGEVDAVMPMIYPASVLHSPDAFTQAQFAVLVSDFLSHSSGSQVLPGISAEYGEFSEIADRIAIARNLGAPGHAVFSARLVEQNRYWDDFAQGPHQSPARPPVRVSLPSGGGR